MTLDYFNFAPNGVISSRQIEVTFVTLRGGWTGIRADAQVVWIYPRTQAQMVPPHTDAIVVRMGSRTRRIKELQPLAGRLIRRFDRLEVVQPGTWSHCYVIRRHQPTVSIEFHAFNPRSVARAVAPDTGFSTDCNPIVFTVHGRTTRLVGGDFVRWLRGELGWKR